MITYGPGAILEGPKGPRIIPRPELGLFNSENQLKPSDFEISDQRMSKGLLRGARIFRLPSNAEIGVIAGGYLYRTRAFPYWRLCQNTSQHGDNFYVLFQERSCPMCRQSQTTEPIRFIRACPKGHMDDVDWYYLVHHASTACQHIKWFKWWGGGGALNQVEIECPRCSSRVKLGLVYTSPWPCSGRFPENEPLHSQPIRSECDSHARIIQRQASNLRIPELRTLFTIPPRHTKLHNLLQLTPIYSVLVGAGISSLEDLERILRNLATNGLINQSVINEILLYPRSEIEQAIQDVLTIVSSNYEDLILEEFQMLVQGSVTGVPPVTGPAPTAPVIFEINPHLVRCFDGPNGNKFRIVPVSKLRTVTVQVGYRREVDTQNPAEMVDIGFNYIANPDQKWYPGVEFLGEGIFIMLDSNDGRHYDLEGTAAAEWQRAYLNASIYPSHVFRGSRREELHPVFVWWHTLAHLIIRSVSIEAGYSTASIRERIYFQSDSTGIGGGILLYATEPSNEGTLGGLIALVPYFNDILDTALETLQSCSGDPLCAENHFNFGGYNGAVCYACVLVSETSCEHRNMWLDRNILRDNLP